MKHYTTMESLREDFGLKPIRKRTKNKQRLESLKKKFQARHNCPICGEPLIHIEDTNVMVCVNEKCKGTKIKTLDAKEETVDSSAFHILDDAGARIANNILHE